MRLRGDGRLEISRKSVPGVWGSEPTGATVADIGEAGYLPGPDVVEHDTPG
jgi:hypothetical protein